MLCTQQETLLVSAKLPTMRTKKLLIATALSVVSCSVFAQWQWTDETGRKVFSDRPPPAHISPQQILKQPSHSTSASERVVYPSAANTTIPAPTAAPVEQVPTPAVKAVTPEQAAQAKQATENEAKDKALEDAKRKAEEAEQKKQAAQQAKARQENCQRARVAQASLQSGGLLATVNAKGERSFMTEEQRKADLQRAQQAIKNNCS